MAQSKAFDSNAGSWPKFSGFRALEDDKKQIRVLRFKRSSSNGTAQYFMEHQTLGSARFAALSYSWGAPVPSAAQKQIVISNELVLIRPTLHAFFISLAAYDPEVPVWIDAVCIDQSNVDERNHQISIMGDIYRSAQKVYVWLGKGDDDTNYVFEHIGNANPQTQFDVRQYSPCAEKLFKLSYWTRRWVIQEFALAKELFIVCGNYVTTWQQLTQVVDTVMLANDERAQLTMRNFDLLRTTHRQQMSSLSELMKTYQSFRCIDRRDRAFALRGIASNGDHLSPDYNESVADVYYRVLSMMHLDNVLPEMNGYRWPHQAAVEMQQCLSVTVEDFLESLEDKPSDRLFASLEFIDIVASTAYDLAGSQIVVLCQTVVTSRSNMVLRGHGDFRPGDLIFNVYHQHSAGSSPYIVFRPEIQVSKPVGVLHVAASRQACIDLPSNTALQEMSRALEYLETTQDVICNGITRCSRNSTARQPQNRILCHFSRAALFWRWSLFSLEKAHFNFLDHYRDLADRSNVHCLSSCSCHIGGLSKQSEAQRHDSESLHLEVLPAIYHDIVVSARTHFFSGDKQVDVPEWLLEFVRACMNRTHDTDAPPHDQRTPISYAAEEGHVSWTEHLLLQQQETVDNKDGNGRTPLSWAMEGGHEDVVKLLLASEQVDPNSEDRRGQTPLIWAIDTGFREGVEILLATGKVDPNDLRRSSRRPLSWAAQSGHSNVAEALLSSDRIDPDAEDVDGVTPLQWAARYGNEAIVAQILATGKVDCNKKNVHSRTALMYAVEKGYTRIVELLLKVDDIDLEIMDNERRTALRLAAQLDYAEIFQLLLDSGKAKLNFQYNRVVKKKRS